MFYVASIWFNWTLIILSIFSFIITKIGMHANIISFKILRFFTTFPILFIDTGNEFFEDFGQLGEISKYFDSKMPLNTNFLLNQIQT